MKITANQNGTVRITGLKTADLNFMANAIESGSWNMGKGGEGSEACMRLAAMLRYANSWPTRVTECHETPTTTDDDFFTSDITKCYHSLRG